MWVGYDSWVAHTQWDLHGQRQNNVQVLWDRHRIFDQCWIQWLVAAIVLQSFLYPRWCRDSSINSSAQFLGITWIAVGCFTPRSISSVLLSVLWLWHWQVWLDVWIVWWGLRPGWEDTLWIWSAMAWMVRKPRSGKMWVFFRPLGPSVNSLVSGGGACGWITFSPTWSQHWNNFFNSRQFFHSPLDDFRPVVFNIDFCFRDLDRTSEAAP